jgi:hypothetical protein
MPAPHHRLSSTISRFLSVSRQWLLGATPAPGRTPRAALPSTQDWPAHQARLRAMWIAHGQQR